MWKSLALPARTGVIIDDATDRCIAPCIKGVNEGIVSRALLADGLHSGEQACGCSVCEVLVMYAITVRWQGAFTSWLAHRVIISSTETK
jgi:hypothetical protein